MSYPYDRDYVREAIELAANGVLPDPSNREIVEAVEEIVGRPIPERWADRFEGAIVSAWEQANDLTGEVTGEDRRRIEASVVNVWGLC